MCPIAGLTAGLGIDSLRLDLQERGNAANQTDVKQLDAEWVDTAREGDQWVVSVRFHGLIQEDAKLGGCPAL